MATTFFQESFLDLKFNNHWVSEYGLVVVSDGSRYSETLFPDFTHTTATVPGKTGTVYWGTTLSGRIITKKLVTDGMTSRQYATFKSHFKPGTYANLDLGNRRINIVTPILMTIPILLLFHLIIGSLLRE